MSSLSIAPLSAPILVGLGIVCAVMYRVWLQRHNEDWFVVLGALTLGVAWIHLLATALLGGSALGVIPIRQSENAVLAVCYALSYPFWFWLGSRVVFLLVGRRPEEGGLLWLYRIEDTTEEFDSSWE